MIGHICSDINQGALPAILPFIISAYGYSYAHAAVLVTCMNLGSAVIQPLFGWMNDRHDRPWTMALGIFLAGAGMSAIGLVGDQFWLMVLCACVSGIGGAIFHPEGGHIANIAAGKNKGRGISIFAVGGNVGFAAGPAIAAASAALFGLSGTFVFLIPSTICALWILWNCGKITRLSARGHMEIARSGAHDNVGGFTLVAVAACIRSICYTGILTFVPLFVIDALGQSQATGSTMLTVFAVVAIVATIAGGRMADHFGLRNFVRVAYIPIVPLFALFAYTTSMTSALILVILLGLCNNLGYSSLTALGQSYLPNHVSMATGITIGVGVAMGGIMAPALGAFGDSAGLPAVFLLMTGIAALAAVLLLFVPKLDSGAHQPQEDTAETPAA